MRKRNFRKYAANFVEESGTGIYCRAQSFWAGLEGQVLCLTGRSVHLEQNKRTQGF